MVARTPVGKPWCRSSPVRKLWYCPWLIERSSTRANSQYTTTCDGRGRGVAPATELPTELGWARLSGEGARSAFEEFKQEARNPGRFRKQDDHGGSHGSSCGLPTGSRKANWNGLLHRMEATARAFLVLAWTAIWLVHQGGIPLFESSPSRYPAHMKRSCE